MYYIEVMTLGKRQHTKIHGNNKNANTLDEYYTTVKSENGNNEIGLVQIYTPKNKQNITAYLIGTVENGENKLSLKALYSDTSVLGATQLDSQIAQDESIQSEIESLTVTGAKITRNMIIVPVENTLLYIEPIYQTLVNESNLPALKKVVVASGNKVAIGDNLQNAVKNLISQYATSIELDDTEDIDGLIDSIIKANDNLTESLNSNSWQLMGTDIQKLQELITQLQKQVKKDEENTQTDETTNSTKNDDEENKVSQNAQTE